MADDELDPFHQHQLERSQRLYRPMEVLNEENTHELIKHTRSPPGSSHSRTRPTLKPRRPHNLRNKYERIDGLRQNHKHERATYKREYISATQEYRDFQASHAAAADEHTPDLDRLIADYADGCYDDDDDDNDHDYVPGDNADDDMVMDDEPAGPGASDDDVWDEFDDAEIIYLLEQLRVGEQGMADGSAASPDRRQGKDPRSAPASRDCGAGTQSDWCS